MILLLTSTGYANDDVNRIISQTETDIKLFLTDIVEDGKRQNEIRKDFTTENIVESLHNLYMGIQYFWLTFSNADIDSIFEKDFDMTWQAIECQ